ncbi:MAG: alpha-galactosidase [Planctomycetaceae bacterium]|nr:alpha-galactosidase [Planctomycetaceae bacterium]
MISTDCCTITFPGIKETLWEYRLAGSSRAYGFAPPAIEIDNRRVTLAWDKQEMPPRAAAATVLANGAVEHRFAAPVAGNPNLRLELVLRIKDGCPVVRFCYKVHSTAEHSLTKSSGRDELTYLAFSLTDLPAATEVRLSEFTHRLYSYMPGEYDLEPRHFESSQAVVGPIIAASGASESLLVAYEHGSVSSDPYLMFHLDSTRGVTLRAVKGNYFSGQPLAPGQPFETIWFDVAAVAGDEADLAAAFRSFLLKVQCPNLETRKPYIFYNTWINQCLGKAAAGEQGSLLDGLKQERILAEIDRAAKMGVEVFVLDAGWFTRCGDWPVNTKLLDGDLSAVRERLARHGMKLGLWLSTQAGINSPIYQAYRDCAMSWRGTEIGIWKVWETEPGQHLCLASRYVEAFADQIVRLARELGATYFKWDAFGHYGCDRPEHLHGDASTSVEERGQCYTFLFDRFMQRLADAVTAAVPEAICDFDVTEPYRNFGLGFLASGKYFLMNDPTTMTSGYIAAPIVRSWGARTTLAYDKWIPSVLTLTHYMPDEPLDSQMVNIASLILGHNGIWGDIMVITEEGAARFGRWLGLYKQVRDDITASTLAATGSPGGNPEIYEKISQAGRGVVCIFATISPNADVRGGYTYMTRRPVSRQFVASDGVEVTFDGASRAIIRCTFGAPSAKIIFFGASE